eukprot:UN28203
MFYHILEYLRNRKCILDDLSDIQLKQLMKTSEKFAIEPLTNAIKKQLEPKRKLDWIDTECLVRGIRTIAGSNITFIVAKQAYWNFDQRFDVPQGYKWSTMAEFAVEFERSKENIQSSAEGEHVYPGWGCGRIRLA